MFMRRRSIYFLNIHFIRVYYRFNRSRVLQAVQQLSFCSQGFRDDLCTVFFCYILFFLHKFFCFYLQIVVDLMMYLCQAENVGFYPPEIVSLKGMMMFKVEKTASAGVMFDGSFRVKRV